MLRSFDTDCLLFQDDCMAVNAFPNFEEIRRSGKLCDVTLIVGEHRFSAHRVVLAATIPYFKAMFTNDMAESSKPEISMQGIDKDVFEQLINFAYSGRLLITVTNVQPLLVGASFLQLQTICEACNKFLHRMLRLDNVLWIRQFAAALGCCELLLNACDRFINKNFVLICRSEEFLRVDPEDLADLLDRDGLYVVDEEQVLEALLTWVNHESKSRRQLLPKLLVYVRLPLIKPQHLTDRVASDNLLKSCLVCRDLVDEAKDYHLMPERRPLLHSFRANPRYCDDVLSIIYAVGGLAHNGSSLSIVEKYDTTTNRWSKSESMTVYRSRVGVAVMGGKMFSIGGFDGCERLQTVEVFDSKTRKWQQICPLANKRSALAAAVVGDHLYVYGGYDGKDSLSSAECYDPETDRWCAIVSMSKPRSAAGVTVLGGKMYVIGGHDGMSIFQSVECYDPATRRWSTIKPMLNKRCRLGAATLNGKIYVCGGYDGSQFLRTVEIYNPENEEWTVGPSMSVKRSRVSLVSNCGKLYAIGGYDGACHLSSMEIFDVSTATWHFGASMMSHEGGVGVGVIPVVFPGEIENSDCCPKSSLSRLTD